MLSLDASLSVLSLGVVSLSERRSLDAKLPYAIHDLRLKIVYCWWFSHSSQLP